MRLLATTLLIAAACSLTAALPAGPASAATAYGENLLKNPGAESGAPGALVPRWETDTDFTVVPYGSPGVPSLKQGKSIDGGRQLFSTGPYSMDFDACGLGIQFIKIKQRDKDIDSGKVRVTLQGYLGTKSISDQATVTIQFRDGNNHQVGSKQLTIGPVSTAGKLLEDTASRTVPDGTRILRVQLLGNPVEQTCDAFFDNLSVVLELR
jgi:hypothetical protein